MEMIEISNSSRIKAIGYDASTGTLRIQFAKSGAPTYEYSGVPLKVYDELRAAESAGRYFEAHIRNAGYDYRKLDDEIVVAASA